jgi:N,N'-diacetyllegionaminate synthase
MEAHSSGFMNSAEITIGNRKIGPGHPCLVIAEAGVNHNGRLDLAKQLIDAAVEAGADVVKFQTFKAEQVVARGAQKAGYQKTGSTDTQTMYEMLKELELSWDHFRDLKKYADSRGIMFMSKGHLEDVDFLVELGVPALKIDSAAVVYFSLLSKAARSGLPLVVSTGASNLGEVERALAVIAENGNPPVVLLHCTTAYPSPPEQTNLRAMATLQAAFGTLVGHSDHSVGIEIPLAAAALGATVIEKHYTLDRNMPGPDHKASLEPGELRQMISGIRKIHAAMGDARKQPTALEKQNLPVLRRSLIAERDIAAGERFAAGMIGFKRPGTGLGQDLLPIVLGRTAAVRIRAGDPITWATIGGFPDA